MFGRLPVKYRLTIWIAGLLTFVLVGGWSGLVSTHTLSWLPMAALGGMCGVMAVAAFLHLFGEQPHAARPSHGAPRRGDTRR